jgi:hypothetical protein
MNILAGKMTQAKVDFTVYGGSKGTIDDDFSFAVRAYDAYLNLAVCDSNCI